MIYNAKAECLQAKFYFGYWNSFGISQHQIQKFTSLFWQLKLLNCCIKWSELHREKTPVKQGNSKTISNSSIQSGCFNAST